MELESMAEETPTNVFNVLSFERKLVELIEELRLSRDLEIENEKNLKSIMDEKYAAELSWEEQHRTHIREKDDLEQQIRLLKRKLEDRACVSDDDKAKQLVINKTYSHEIRMLKEELRISKSEKLNLQKKIQELEGKLSLHNQFQESILSQVADVRKTWKQILEENQELTKTQKNVTENVSSAMQSFRKLDLFNQHLLQHLTIIQKKNEAFKKELISCRSELALSKNLAPRERKSKNICNDEIEKLQKKVLDLQNLLLFSRKENEKTLANFMQSNELLCQFTEKYAAIHEREKQLMKEIESAQDKLATTETKLQEATKGIKRKEELETVTQKERLQNQTSVAVQTLAILNTCVSKDQNSGVHQVIDFHPDTERLQESFVEESRNYLLCHQQNSKVLVHSEEYTGNGLSRETLREIATNELLKRMIDAGESVPPNGNTTEQMPSKRNRVEANSHLEYNFDNTKNGGECALFTGTDHELPGVSAREQVNLENKIVSEAPVHH